MRYTVTRQVVHVIGHIWQPGVGVCAMSRDLSAHDLANIEDPKDRTAVADWIAKHFGDFQEITDFRADFTIDDESVIHDWQSEESEAAFFDAMYPSDD